ncbi:MAG: divergent polysaccharide deacetylase family protein [Amphritea sp.]
MITLKQPAPEMRRYLLSVLGLMALLITMLSLACSVRADEAQPRLILIIDDLGDNLAQGVAAIGLPGPVAYAILPHTPHSKTLAEMAHRQGKEVMLHVPMANTHNRRLGPGALTADLAQGPLIRVLEDDIDSVPYVVGINNHMGSLLTQRQETMGWVMEVVARRGLFFVDSVTTAKTAAWKAAFMQGIPWMMRDVFLDHEQTTAFVDKQFRLAVALARQQGFAVLIGHPYPVTVSYLEEALPTLGELGVQLVAPSGLLLQQSQAKRLADIRRQEIAQSCSQEGMC